MKITILYFFVSLLLFPSSVFSTEYIASNDDAEKNLCQDRNNIKKSKVKKPVSPTTDVEDVMHLSGKELDAFVKKAEQGDVDAANDLGLRYDIVERDYDKAVYWIRFSAENGSAVGQYNLGLLLLRYDSEDKFDEAIEWLELAEKNGKLNARFDIDSALKRHEKRKAMRENKK